MSKRHLLYSLDPFIVISQKLNRDTPKHVVIYTTTYKLLYFFPNLTHNNRKQHILLLLLQLTMIFINIKFRMMIEIRFFYAFRCTTDIEEACREFFSIISKIFGWWHSWQFFYFFNILIICILKDSATFAVNSGLL